MKLVGKLTDALALLTQGDSQHREMIQACHPAFQALQREIKATAPKFVAKTRAEARPQFAPPVAQTGTAKFQFTASSPFVTPTNAFGLPSTEATSESSDSDYAKGESWRTGRYVRFPSFITFCLY